MVRSAGFLAAGEQKMASRSMGASGATNAKVTLGTITPAVGRRSSCGNQVSSTDNSHPSYGFGTATRDTFAKRYISNQHVKVDPLDARTPGPGAYGHRVSTGKQTDSTLRTQAQWGFGTADRFHVQNKTLKATGAIPGPGAYFT